MEQWLKTHWIEYALIGALSAMVIIMGLTSLGKHIPVAATVSIGTAPTGPVTCMADGRAWPARQDGGSIRCFMSDKPK